MGLRMTEPRRSGEPNPVPLERETAAGSQVLLKSQRGLLFREIGPDLLSDGD